MISWGRVFQLRQRLKGNLWVLPLLGGAAGSAFAELVAPLDRALDLPSGWQYTSGSASSVLSAIVGAMIGLLGFVVTVSVLVVQQATGTLSPRYMRLWYRDRLQKVVLAFFVGTFTYSYSLLRRVGTDSVPNLGVTLAGLAVGFCLVLLLLYVNRFTHNLRPVAVAASVAATGRQVLARYDSLWAGEAPRQEVDVSRLGPVAVSVRCRRSGAIQAVAARRLVAEATRHDWLLVLVHPVGDFVPAGTPLIEVHRPVDGGSVQSVPGRAARPDELGGLLALGTERTVDQDPAFALRILVDIAIRALSPAVNDPTTAVQVLDYVEDLLQSMATLPLRPHYALGDAEGRPRLLVPGRTWGELLSLGVTEIRLYGGSSPQVCRRLRALLEGLLVSAPAERRTVVTDEIRRLDDAVERSFPDAAARAFAGTSDRQGIGGRSAEPIAPGLSPQGHDVPRPAAPAESSDERAR